MEAELISYQLRTKNAVEEERARHSALAQVSAFRREHHLHLGLRNNLPFRFREKEKTADQCLRIATDERAGHVVASSPLPPIKTTLEKPDKKAKTGDRDERGVDGLGSEASVTKIRLVLKTPISPYRHRRLQRGGSFHVE